MTSFQMADSERKIRMRIPRNYHRFIISSGKNIKNIFRLIVSNIQVSLCFFMFWTLIVEYTNLKEFSLSDVFLK